MKLKDQRLVFKMTLLGLSLALFIALSFASVNLQFIKISMSGIPLIFISVVYGPLEGALLGLVGEFLCQLMTYGITPTTALWVLPAVVRGLIVGFMFKQKDVREHPILWILTIIVSCLAVTIINTFVIYLDAKIFEYPSQLTTITILIRFAGSIGSAIIYAIVVPALFLPLIKQGKFDINNDTSEK